MRIATIAFLLAALALGLFAWWGLYTIEGRHRFDEMDGLYPFFAGCGAVVCLIVSAVLFALHRRRAGA